MIERTQYLDRLERWRDKRVIKVITGIRRCGKSTLMAQYQERLLQSGVEPSQIIAINLEDFAFAELLDPKALHAHILERIPAGKKAYVFLDEVQNVPDFQRVVDSLFLREGIDLYITGSNAYMLSGELATLLTGRYVTVEMLPLSFAEYVSWTGSRTDLQRKYASYLEQSSFPYATELGGDATAVDEYLRGIYSTIVLKDVVGRLKSVDPMMLESVLRFVFDSIGSRLSTKKIADTLSSMGRKIDTRTVERYLSACIDSYILYRAPRFDVKGKQHLKTLEKYYAADIGLRSMLLGRKHADAGHILENVVYLELLRRGHSVFVGKVGEQEVDFVAQSRDGLAYYQVAASVRDEQTLERELRVLRKIGDNYPKYLLTLDEDPDEDFEGIRKRNALDWLLEEGGR
ncbi:MAG: ATP-binding protein [Coriobacteriales bacterium]